jgi:hypothetical protein
LEVVSQIIKHLVSPDGQTRITVYRRSDGRFEFSYDKFYVDDLPEHEHHMEYWVLGQPSGVFDSAETTIREASVEFPWISAGNSYGAS